MSMEKRVKFLKILRIELEDMEHDLDVLVEHYLQSEAQKQVREHVCHENIAVLKNERCGLEHFTRIVDSIHPDDYGDLPSLVAGVEEKFKKEIKRADLADAAYMIVDRKIDKIVRYVE